MHNKLTLNHWLWEKLCLFTGIIAVVIIEFTARLIMLAILYLHIYDLII